MSCSVSSCGECGAVSYLPANADIFPPIVTGQVMPEIIKVLVSQQGANLERAYIHFKSDPDGPINLTLDSDVDSQIELTQPLAGTWEITIPSFTVSLPKESYIYQFWTVDSDGFNRCLLTGIWEITSSF